MRANAKGRIAIALLALAALAAPAHAFGDGTLDPSFGGDGRIDSGACGLALAIDSEGRIVCAGYRETATSPFPIPADGVLARYLPDGSPDPSFGEGGVKEIHVEGKRLELESVAIDQQGRIVAAGTATSFGEQDFAAVRLLPNGQPDPEFSGDGYATADSGLNDQAFDVALDSAGRVVLGGSIAGHAPDYEDTMAAVRLLSNGSPDPSFGAGGIANPDVPGEGIGDGGDSIAVDGEGRIVLGGGQTVLRLRADGSLDPAFGEGGIAPLALDPNAYLYDFAIDRLGRIVLAGAVEPSDAGDGHVKLVRLGADGQLDPSFGDHGQADFSTGPGNNDSAYVVAIDPAGRVVTAGQSLSAADPSHGGLLDRFTESGSLDTSFGTGGYFRQNWGDQAIDFDREGRYVVSGAGVIVRLNVAYPCCVALSTTPDDGASGVSRKAPITVLFSQAMDKPSAEAAFSLRRTSNSDRVSGSFSWTGNRLQFTPGSPLAAARAYTATVGTGAQSPGGTHLSFAKTWKFTTTPQPLIASVYPAAGASGVSPSAPIVVGFDAAMDKPSAQAAFSLRRTSNGAPVSGSFGWYGTALIFKPASDLSAGVTYTARETNAARNLDGRPLEAGRTWAFSIAR